MVECVGFTFTVGHHLRILGIVAKYTVPPDRTSDSQDKRTDKRVRLSGETVFHRIGPRENVCF